MNAKNRTSHRPSGSDLAHVDAHVIGQDEYVELPELTEDMLARGKLHIGGQPNSSDSHVGSSKPTQDSR